MAVPGALSGVLSATDAGQQTPGRLDVASGVSGPDSGDRFAGGFGQVGEPVGAGGGQLAGVGEQDADVAVGLVAAVAGRPQSGQDRIGGLPGAGYGVQDGCGCVHGVTALRQGLR